MTFADEVRGLLLELDIDPDTITRWVDYVGPDSTVLHFANAANPARHTAIYLDRGCDLSALPAAVAVQVYAVTG